METFILTLHLIVCIFLIVLVLLQSGKEGMGVIFGGGSSSLFGSSGAGGFLVKFTAVCAGLFLITSLTYAYLVNSAPTSDSIMDNIETSAPPVEETPLLPPADGTNEAPADTGADTQGLLEVPAAETPAPDVSAQPSLRLDDEPDSGLDMPLQEGQQQ